MSAGRRRSCRAGAVVGRCTRESAKQALGGKAHQVPGPFVLLRGCVAIRCLIDALPLG